MPAPSRKILGFAILLPALLLGSCGSSNTAEVDVLTIGNPDDPFEQGVRLSSAGQLSRAALAEGLVAFDEEGRVISALADRWIVTDDGKSYIFRLRDGIWRDGSEITARTGLRALRGSLRALRGTALGFDLDSIQDIREMAGRVIEIRLVYPMPHFLQILAQPELGMMHGGKGAGPMALDRDGQIAKLTPIPPDELGLPVVPDWAQRARTIGLSSVDGEEAMRRFNSGEVDIVLGGRIADFPRTSSVGILRGTIQLDPVDGLFGLQFAQTKGFLSAAANREALAMAIDREALIAPFGLDGWVPSTAILPADLEGDAVPVVERWPDMTIEDRRALAANRVAAWRKGQDENREVRVSVWLPKGPGSDILFQRLASDFVAIGVRLYRADREAGADMRLVDTVARYPRATWFLNRFNCKVRKVACVREADAKLAEARREEDAVKRAELVGEAAIALTDANVFIPFGPPIRWSLVRGNVRGFSRNRWGWHPLMPMALLPK